tara:strand:- start:1145 stop:2137 length:993 start_codon:yes stop_codon:yes gene_type:complete
MNSNILNTSKVYYNCYGIKKSNFFKILPDKDISKLLKKIKEKDKKFDIKNQTVLIAGGSGRAALSFLKKNPKNIFYVDLVKQNIDKIKKISKNKIKCLHADLDTLNKTLGNQKFDIIYMEGVFQHLQKPNLTVNKLYKRLNIGGVFYLDFYRSGIIYWLLVELLRKKINFQDFQKFKNYLNLKKLTNKKITYSRSNLSERLYDDLFVPNIRFYNAEEVKRSIQNSRAKIIYCQIFKKLSRNFNSYKYFSIILKKSKTVVKKFNIVNEKNEKAFSQIDDYKKFILNFNKLKFKSKKDLFILIIKIFQKYSSWHFYKDEKKTILTLNKFLGI